MTARAWLLILLGVASAGLPARAATTEVGSTVRVYDDNKTKVISPQLEARTVFNKERNSIKVGVASDIITSSSSDVVTNSTGNVKEERKEASLAMDMQVADGTVAWSYVRSAENDWTSNGYTLSASRELFEKNTVLGVNVTVGDDNVRSSRDRLFSKYFYSNTYGISLTQVLNKQSVLQFLYDIRVENGYLESPYRTARMLAADGTFTLLSEKVPESRARNTFTVKYNYFKENWRTALNNTLRFYNDTWAVTSLTYKIVATTKLTGKFFLSYGVRLYLQTKANFYEDYYTSSPVFRTGNKTLADLNSYQIELRPIWHVWEGADLYLKFEYFTQDFKNHTAIGKAGDKTDDQKLQLQATVVGLGYTQSF